MNKSKFLIIFSLFIVLCLSLGSVFAADDSNSTDTLKVINESSPENTLNVPEEDNSLEQSEDMDNLTVSESDSCENLSVSLNDSENVLSSSVSVSSGHTFKKCGYTFKVSDNQYKKIKQAISAGKKHKFLDWGFNFKVKTNKVVKVKVLVKTKTYYKKVRYEGITRYPYNGIKLANLKSYYNNGWKKYSTGFDIAKNSKKYLGYNYVKLKKTVKTYKTVKMRVYANIGYVGEYDYVTGEHVYYPVVEFDAMKKGYPSKCLDFTLLM